MEENITPTPEQEKVEQKPGFIRRFKLPLIIGASSVIIALVVGGILLTGKDKTAQNTTNTPVDLDKDAELAATGYTGIKEDVIKKYTYDCAPRNEHEWYRSDRTFTIDYKNPDTMYINVEYKGLFKTTDGGKTWAQKTKGIKVYARKDDPSKGCYSEYPVIRMDPKDSKHLMVGISGGGGGFLDADTPNSQTGGAYQTYDGGETWKLMINNRMDIYVTDLAIDPNDSKTYYYGTSSTPASWQGADQNKIYVTKGIIYKTTTGAKDRDWIELPTGLGNRTGAQSILINRADSKQLIVPTFSAVRESADGTGTGESTGKDTSVTQVGIMKSADGGKTWTTVQLPGNPPITQGFASESNFLHQFYVPQGTNGAVSYASLDGAVTFQKSNIAMDIVAYDPFDTTGNHMLGYSTTVGTPTIPNLNLFESNDGGLSWKPHGKLPAEIKDLNNTKTRPSVITWHPTDKNTIFMSGAGGHIWKSTDFGSSWVTLLDYTKLP